MNPLTGTRDLVAEVRAEMARQGVTASKIAEATDISQPSLSRKLSGAREFTTSELLTVLGALDVTLATIAARAEAHTQDAA